MTKVHRSAPYYKPRVPIESALRFSTLRLFALYHALTQIQPRISMVMEATSPDMYDDNSEGEHWETDIKHESQTSPAGATGSSSHSKPQLPMQKRRRVTRACDECRRKKIKCDGKQPCTHCTVYSYGKPLVRVVSLRKDVGSDPI